MAWLTHLILALIATKGMRRRASIPTVTDGKSWGISAQAGLRNAACGGQNHQGRLLIAKGPARPVQLTS
ncbi:hypothetical protein BOSEA31B_15106 [Hyphomicrobiales bacterium]|nr:hypothetical protein BOSEA31B_15106 [Hyphomicrobiales bacterium]CAH1701598.1 hypothetical protein BOSEA1005_21297 [Hyphomicrobiales bacterium]CAI0345764.1 hypothetical protein BO1005MUT1_440003 [Hyphomicrobiales bacterium]